MISIAPRVTIINVAGLCHGPEEYARSPIHDMVAKRLMDTGLDIKTVFVPSTEIREGEGTVQPVGIQHQPHEQQLKICNIVKTAVHDYRIPIAVAHSSGSIATMAALMSNSLQNAVIVSPTFLDPLQEIFESPAFKRRLIPVDQSQSDYQAMMSPTAMNYSTMFPSNHFSDHLYMDPIIFSQDRLKEIIKLISAMRVRILIGQHDWNEYRDHYPRIFDVDIIEGETHSFEAKLESVETVVKTIQKMIKLVMESC